MPKVKSSKRKIQPTGQQYDPDFSDNEKEDVELSEEIICKRKDVIIPTNSTNIGQLYMTGNDNIVSSKILYIGKTPYNVIEKLNPVDDFYHYFQTVINDVFGFIDEHNLSVTHIRDNPARIACHMFLAMLYYNHIIIPNKIKLHTYTLPIILGECIFYNKQYENNRLNVYVSNTLIQNLFYKQAQYDMTFSNRINHEKYSLKYDITDNFGSNNGISREMYKYLITLFVVCDHAATHYIEEYKTNDTDWIHHQNFGRSINSYSLINSIFEISARIEKTSIQPKMYADVHKNHDTSFVNNFDSFGNISSTIARPGDIAQITDLINIPF